MAFRCVCRSATLNVPPLKSRTQNKQMRVHVDMYAQRDSVVMEFPLQGGHLAIERIRAVGIRTMSWRGVLYQTSALRCQTAKPPLEKPEVYDMLDRDLRRTTGTTAGNGHPAWHIMESSEA
jgi:hypothetical protein